ncbi:tryptophan synthase beta subunit-like PLP-dependent enzyme [Amylostereum chailletii]|nr:tryptophan synthase beta subunit-like PLP-dependent enzyme [Amylostereum chailletii]
MSKLTHQPRLWLETPLIYSSHISQRLGPGYNVYLKLETVQPSHSFKSRGISHYIREQFIKRGPSLHVVCASGGNAGLAAACASKTLGVKCTIFLPEGVDAGTHRFLAAQGADVVVGGAVYQEALNAASARVSQDENAVLAPAYDDKVVWDGHASMVEEIQRQLPQGETPDAIFCCVGGGGLLGGIIVGCERVGWDGVPIVALETHGANCFIESISANKWPDLLRSENVTVLKDEEYGISFVRLGKLTSKATSLGATAPSAGVVNMALKRSGGVQCASIPDEMAMQVVLSFADDHKTLVELACATTLAPAYAPGLLQRLVPTGPGQKTLVFVVCGGFKVSTEHLKDYTDILENHMSKYWDVKLPDGETLSVPR